LKLENKILQEKLAKQLKEASATGQYRPSSKERTAKLSVDDSKHNQSNHQNTMVRKI